MSFRPALANDRLWEGEMLRVETDNIAVVLVRLHGEVHAYRDACPHQAAALSLGTLKANRLTCRAHGWQFDAITGRGINPPKARLCRIPARVRDGMIEIDIATTDEDISS